MKIAALAVVATAALTFAGSALAAPGDELTGNSLQVRLVGSSGRSVLHFIPDHRVHLIAREGGQEMQDVGRWTLADGRICFDWQTQADECWSYPEALPMNRVVRSTRSGGTMQADVILLSGHDHGVPDETPARP